MQIYSDIPTLTAQPSIEEKKKAPHVLYGVLDGSARCNAARWVEMAREQIQLCFTNGQTPIITGGTGFYIKALIEGLSPIPDIPEDIRSMSIQLLDMTGAPALHAIVSGLDPEIGRKLEPNDSQRLAYAWAVHETTGKPLSEWQKLPRESPPENWRFDVTLILPNRDELRKRIARRFHQMMDEGAMEEVEALHKRIENGEVSRDAAITVAYGFSCLQEYLRGNISLEEAKSRSISDTNRYAKRQYTWFRHQINESDAVKVNKITA